MSSVPGFLWAIFGGLVLVLLGLDLFGHNRKARVLGVREASRWSAFVISVALLFGLVIVGVAGRKAGLEYYAGYLIELSLSVDNLFVFLLIFQYFAVPAKAQPRVLSWGIFGAIILRGIMIALGALMLARYSWIIYVFGAILIVTAVKMFRESDIRIEPEKNPLVKVIRRLLPMSDGYDDEKFFVRTRRGWLATPLLLVVGVVEWTDLIFAIDSIPAIFGITRDPFIVFSSNIMAIVGLRAMYFVLADAMERFHYLKPGVALILGFVGVKMVAGHWVHISVGLSLAVILLVLLGSILLSLRREALDARS